MIARWGRDLMRDADAIWAWDPYDEPAPDADLSRLAMIAEAISDALVIDGGSSAVIGAAILDALTEYDAICIAADLERQGGEVT